MDYIYIYIDIYGETGMCIRYIRGPIPLPTSCVPSLPSILSVLTTPYQDIHIGLTLVGTEKVRVNPTTQRGVRGLTRAPTPLKRPMLTPKRGLTVEMSAIAPQREQAPSSRPPCSTCRRRGVRLRCARFVRVTNGCQIVTDKPTCREVS